MTVQHLLLELTPSQPLDPVELVLRLREILEEYGFKVSLTALSEQFGIYTKSCVEQGLE